MKMVLSFLISLFIVESAGAIGQVNIAYSPYTISRPGTYIVVADLTTAINQNCITITTCNVTLDLNAHTLYGFGTTRYYSGTYGTGILATTVSIIQSTTAYLINNIEITNGTIMNFQNYGVCLMGFNLMVSKLRVFSNVSAGISINTTKAFLTSAVRDNLVYGNLGDGIDVGNGCFITGNNVQSNASTGISAGYSCFIKDNICRLNGVDGIRVYTENQVIENQCNNNVGNGIEATSNENSIIGNYCTLNATGLLCDNSGNYCEQNKLLYNTTNENLNGSTEGSGTLANVQLP